MTRATLEAPVLHQSWSWTWIPSLTAQTRIITPRTVTQQLWKRRGLRLNGSALYQCITSFASVVNFGCLQPVAIATDSFAEGTNVRIENGVISDWKRVEDRFEEKYLDESYAPHGLRLSRFISKEPVLHLAFSPVQSDGLEGEDEETSTLFAQCQLDHPFFVKDKGWCSCNPSLTLEHYGLQCSTLDINDVCLPPHHPDASFTRKAVKSLTSLQFTPEDSHAVFALSQMAMSRKGSSSLEELSRSFPQSPIKSHKKKSSSLYNDSSPLKAKRPMNAFMLFAKEFRVHYTQMHPGKDNRVSSLSLTANHLQYSPSVLKHSPSLPTSGLLCKTTPSRELLCANYHLLLE
ncbi:HBP1 [Bugula neritina]|uniref:HBP1 n=1 Tax=Bugula neritina TaxID=10212 RepID=A0A7J7KSZ5_BUGNE|nr:HBP1 [Bugula neritina]